MTDFIEENYLESDYENLFNNWYEIEGVRKIKELSRQLRTFFNYKSEIIRYRFQTKTISNENIVNTEFFNRKQEIESSTLDFLILLKNYREDSQPLEEWIRSLFLNRDKLRLNELIEITDKLFSMRI